MFQKPYACLTALIFAASVSGAYAQCNTVDAVTKASFRITGGEACDTYANLNWSFTRKNGEMIIEWGTSTEYGSSKSVYSAKPVNLPDLQPDTKYYYHVYGTYKGKTYQYTTSTFTTSGGATANEPPVITSAPEVNCAYDMTKTYTVTATDPDNDQVTFTVSGQPSWITFASPVLTMSPVAGSVNSVVSIIAADGNGGLDTLNLDVKITGTSVISANTAPDRTFRFGTSRITFPRTAERQVTVALYALDGTSVMQRTVPVDVPEMQTLPPGIVPGIYLLRLKNSTRSSIFTIHIKE